MSLSKYTLATYRQRVKGFYPPCLVWFGFGVDSLIWFLKIATQTILYWCSIHILVFDVESVFMLDCRFFAD